MNENIYVVPNPTGPTKAVSIDEKFCVGCNSCADICRVQTLLPNPEKGRPPIVAYPDECWYCACCVEACPVGAIEMHLPINQRIFYKRKETGEIFRLGADDCPPKSYFKPAVGFLDDVEELRDNTYYVWKALIEKKRVRCTIDEQIAEKVAAAFTKEEDPEAARKIRYLFEQMGLFFNQAPCDVEVVLSDSTPEEGKIYLNTELVVKMIRRACVSSFTARKVWEQLNNF